MSFDESSINIYLILKKICTSISFLILDKKVILEG